MAGWAHGYVTDTVYTSQFQRESTPVWLSTAAALLGHGVPDLAGPFRYADLGCGNGLTALVIAATCPQAEVWGFDFNPAHVEFACALAERAGLRNVRFVEAAFADVASGAAGALPEFDFMVSHGVLSWISAENQHHLIDTIRQRLRPGGLAYVSYNVTTGTANMLAVRTLMRLVAESSPERSDVAMAGILDLIDRVRQGGAAYFPANPPLEHRLRDIRAQNPRYLAHEFLNRDWRPLMFTEVADAMAEAKCEYIGSATLPENIDATSVPAAMIPLLGDARTVRVRETLRDLGAAQGFRRDIYRKGTTPVLPGEQQARIEALAFAWTGVPVGEEVTISTSVGTVTGRPELYRPLLDRVLAGPASVPDLVQAGSFVAGDVLQAVTLLMAAGLVHPMLPSAVAEAGRATTRGLNRAIGALNGAGGEIGSLASPVLGTAVVCDLLETLVVGALLDGVRETIPALAAEVLRRLASGGRNVQRDGQVVTDAAEALEAMSRSIGDMIERRGRVWRAAEITG